MIKQYSMCCKLEYKKKEATGSRIRNMPGSTDPKEGLTNRDANSSDFNFSPIAH